MDFDDLDDVAGSPLIERRDALLEEAFVPTKKVPIPQGRKFAGEDRDKLKILFFHGGGTNGRCGQTQVRNIFFNAGAYGGKKWTDNLHFEYFNGPHPVPREWHRAPEMQETMRQFGPEYWLYYGFEPPIEHGGINSTSEEWLKFDETIDKLAEFLRDNGPYDGLCGFDQGGCVIMQAARLAAEGDKRFERKFRFLILFTTVLPKAILKQASFRPSAPLNIPTIVSYSLSDFSRPFPSFEEAALFFDQACREVLIHLDGHIPPKFAEKMRNTERLRTFLQAMGTITMEWTPEKSGDSMTAGLRLPMKHLPAPPVGPLTHPQAQRMLVVIHEPGLGRRAREEVERLHAAGARSDEKPSADPPGPFDASVPEAATQSLLQRLELYAAVAALTVEDFRAAFAAASAGAEAVEVEIRGVEFQEEHAEIEWGTPRELLASTLDPQDVIMDLAAGESKWARAKEVAEHLLEQLNFRSGDQIAVVGLGHGAFIGLHVVRALVTHAGRGATPVGFWAAHAPTAMPLEATKDGAGLLADCPVHYLVGGASQAGSPWRWEVQTLGPFSMEVFGKAEQLPGHVVSQIRDRFLQP